MAKLCTRGLEVVKKETVKDACRQGPACLACAKVLCPLTWQGRFNAHGPTRALFSPNNSLVKISTSTNTNISLDNEAIPITHNVATIS
jgi:hypothetical protein